MRLTEGHTPPIAVIWLDETTCEKNSMKGTPQYFMIADQTTQTLEQFSEMLEAYSSRTFRRGEVVTGTIVYLVEDIAYVDIGAKRDALVPAWDLSSLEAKLLESLKEGAQVQVYVTETPTRNGNLVVSIQRGLREEDWQRAGKLMESEEAREYTVTSANRGGVLVAFGRMDGFVPNSQVLAIRQQPSSRRDEIKQELIGSLLLLKVIDVDQPRQRLVLSEAAARQELRKNRLEELHVGQVLTGTVVSLVPFGAFVDLGGIDGLVHISNLDWKPVADPADVLAEGEQIEVLVTGVEAERERISLKSQSAAAQSMGGICTGA